jgi:hypothetical protein
MSGASGKGADGREGSKERVCEGACMRGRNQGQNDGQSYCNGFSMVHRCGQKPSGEEVSFSLRYSRLFPHEQGIPDDMCGF